MSDLEEENKRLREIVETQNTQIQALMSMLNISTSKAVKEDEPLRPSGLQGTDAAAKSVQVAGKANLVNKRASRMIHMIVGDIPSPDQADPVSSVTNFFIKYYGEPPAVLETSPGTNLLEKFQCRVFMLEHLLGDATGGKKKEAKKEACRDALRRLNDYENDAEIYNLLLMAKRN